VKHVIIEGPDGAGKTTLAQQFVKSGLKYHHEGPPPAGCSVFDHYMSFLDRCDAAGVGMVLDRFHIGEIVYGSILRGSSGITVEQAMVISSRVDRIILCLPPWPVCYGNTRNRPELIKDDEILRVAFDVWHLVSNNPDLMLKATTYDYTKGPYVP